MKRRTTIVGGVLAVIVAVVLPATSAGAATTYEVTVGKFLKGAPAESMRFLPETIDVHQGDTLHFTTQSFHTATLLPVGQGVVDWYDANATIGQAEPYSLVVPDTEDTPDTYRFGNAAVFPTSSTCGGVDQPACSYDGTSVLNSGAPFFGPVDLSATINASAGSSFWVLCLVHGPNMRMRVNVVAGSEPASDPADLKAANTQAVAQDTATAAALNAKYSAKRTWHTEGGHRVWDAWAGVDTRHLSLYGMYPQTLKIAKGDTVQWHFDSLIFEQHTVTFPIDTARAIANGGGPPMCDPDGDAGPAPDGPADKVEPPFCNDPTQLELHLDPRFVPRQGNGTFTGHDLENSGVLGSELPDANYDLRFGARSATGFKYLCMIHTFMRGRVVVR